MYVTMTEEYEMSVTVVPVIVVTPPAVVTPLEVTPLEVTIQPKVTPRPSVTITPPATTIVGSYSYFIIRHHAAV